MCLVCLTYLSEIVAVEIIKFAGMKRCIFSIGVFLLMSVFSVSCTSVRDSKKSSEESVSPPKPKIRPYRPDMATPAEEIRPPSD
jgi:hypothetical protein